MMHDAIPLLSKEGEQPDDDGQQQSDCQPSRIEICCRLLCFGPVCKPCCTICWAVLAVTIIAIVLLQRFVSPFQSSWVEWQYVHDFEVTSIYTNTFNDTRVDYNNQSMLNRTIFHTQNDAKNSVIMYKYMEIDVHFHDMQFMDEVKISFKPTNQSSPERVANNLAVSVKSWYPTPFLWKLSDGEWEDFDTSQSYHDENDTKSIHTSSTSNSAKADNYKIQISNHNEGELTNYYVASVSFHTNEHQLFKAANWVFMCLFSVLLLYNLAQWIKVHRGVGFALFKKLDSFKYHTLLYNAAITACFLCLAVALNVLPVFAVQEKHIFGGQYLGITSFVFALSFFLVFMAWSSSLRSFSTMSWAFIRDGSDENMKYYANNFWLNCCTVCAIVTFSVMLILGFVSVYTTASTRALNVIIDYFMYMTVFYLLFTGYRVTRQYMSIYLELDITNPGKVFVDEVFRFRLFKLVQKYMLNFVFMEWCILMAGGFYSTVGWDSETSEKAYSLCWYYSSVAIYCAITSYFYPVRVHIPWECPTCGYQDIVADTVPVCGICRGDTLPEDEQNEGEDESDDEQQEEQSQGADHENAGQIQPQQQVLNPADVSIQVQAPPKVEIEDALFEEGALEDSDQCARECVSLMRIKQLVDAFHTQSESVFLALFEQLQDYTIPDVLNDNVHILEKHEIQDINETVDECIQGRQCPILQSRLRNLDIGKDSLLISTMKQIHCYLYHNIHRRLKADNHYQINSLIHSRRRRFCETEHKEQISVQANDEEKDDMKEEEDEQDEQETDDSEQEQEAKQEEKPQPEQGPEAEKLPRCICGETLSKELPSVYGAESNVLCDLCKQSCAGHEFVYHCKTAKHAAEHPQGFDLCRRCGLILMEKLDEFKKQHKKQLPANGDMDDDEMKHGDERYEAYTYNEYGFGSFIYYDLLRPKFRTLKEELLNNTMYRVDQYQWNTIFEKARYYVQTKKAKKLVHRRNERRISMPHLIAIISYTDYDDLCKNFRDSFRKLDEKETDNDVMKRHCDNYYHFGKWLNDTITNYGESVSAYTNKQALFHGLDRKFIFASLSTDFNIPTSTTTDTEKAKEFAGTDGLILKLKSKWKHGSSWDKATCLPVAWISHFKQEREVLFFGNFNQLLIEDIVFISPTNDESESLREALDAIHLWEMLCDGYLGEPDLNLQESDEAYSFLVTLIGLQAVRMLLEGQGRSADVLLAGHRNDLQSQVPHYILQLFHHVCEKKKHFSLFGLAYLIRTWRESATKEKLLDMFLREPDESDIVGNMKCPKCDVAVEVISIGKKNKCEGCRRNEKNTAGFGCGANGCEWVVCQVCAVLMMNLCVFLPNAKHQHQVTRLDDMKANALKIELLRSRGLW